MVYESSHLIRKTFRVNGVPVVFCLDALAETDTVSETAYRAIDKNRSFKNVKNSEMHMMGEEPHSFAQMADGTVTRFSVNQLRKRDSFEGHPNHRDHQWIMLFDSGLPNPATAAKTHLTTPAEVPAQRTKPQPSECPKMSNTAQPPH
ncbi:unnamed protein product [Toxocara canis]|uniref:Lipoprotein n=1 Tax=Toxocara canis TaxID=6265 RepID=A0A183VA27_TOXCA|nr:unnamed protein product [Toxocara canis]